MHVFCPTYYWTCSFNALELMLEMPLNSTSNKRLIWKQYRTVLASHHTYALVMLPSAAHHHEEGLQNGLCCHHSAIQNAHECCASQHAARTAVKLPSMTCTLRWEGSDTHRKQLVQTMAGEKNQETSW